MDRAQTRVLLLASAPRPPAALRPARPVEVVDGDDHLLVPGPAPGDVDAADIDAGISQSPREAAQLAGAVIEGDSEHLLNSHDLPARLAQGRQCPVSLPHDEVEETPSVVREDSGGRDVDTGLP